MTLHCHLCGDRILRVHGAPGPDGEPVGAVHDENWGEHDHDAVIPCCACCGHVDGTGHASGCVELYGDVLVIDDHTPGVLRPARTDDYAPAGRRTQLALPPASGRGYDRTGLDLWHVEPWRDGHQVTHAELGRTYREAHDERRAALALLNAELDQRAAEVLGDRYHHPDLPVEPLTPVAAGQQWASRTALPSGVRTVTAVDRGLVDTDRGRTTVFHLNRHYRLHQPAAQETP